MFFLIFIFVITCFLLFVRCLSNTALVVGDYNFLPMQFVFIPTSFGSAHVAPVSFLNKNMNRGRWTQDKHKIFMQEWEKYSNILMKIVKVLSKQIPTQIKKAC